MYSLDEFGEMVGDALRFPAYSEAIARAVRPDDSVVDIGSGPGIFALLACKAGARKVYAIDTEGVVEFGRQFAAKNGFGGRIEFLRGDSRQILLPERANVIVSDIRGALPLFGQGIHTLNDARKRFLAENGRMIPERDKLFAALAEAPENYERIIAPWKSVPGLDLEAALPVVLNTMYKRQCKPEQLLSRAQEWHVLDYLAGANPKAGSTLRFKTTRAGTVHGFTVWFETKLFGEIGFCTKPGTKDSVYGQVFLPLLMPVEVDADEKICADLHADLIGTDYVWRWEFKAEAKPGRNAVDYRQSTFQGGGISPSSLRKRSGEFVPVLSEAGLAERWLFMAMDGKTPLEQIAVKAAELFPHTFSRAEDAFRRAGEISDRYSR
ncbi:MAG TPA: 50S ribosomal protein L11 methyltransferase [Candidatus Dormibacteraeota bacterium]|jgi:protein arginine N-methyltransferase 1|nr:50S ribosomal protein L11 methyltransferase [Candidatus Dormibacteraeota bacterium]